MDRPVRSAERLALLLLVRAVAFSAARQSALGDHSPLLTLIALGVAGYYLWRGIRFIRRFLPKRRATPTGPPVLPSRGHWLSPRTLRRRGRQ